mmetsp:Transcript_25178/g.54537  ORF Transcript_25178/g.54537 Transcript_25178/m.54537 type:complete len:89 (+) Transcript_25178:479-745(+)
MERYSLLQVIVESKWCYLKIIQQRQEPAEVYLQAIQGNGPGRGILGSFVIVQPLASASRRVQGQSPSLSRSNSPLRVAFAARRDCPLP